LLGKFKNSHVDIQPELVLVVDAVRSVKERLFVHYEFVVEFIQLEVVNNNLKQIDQVVVA
jgi:hypothetical protein